MMIFGEKYFEPERAAEKVARWRADGKKVTLALGCFDMLHVGCVRFLAEAAGRGDRLIAGVFDDESVTQSRGQGRPVLKLAHRLDMAAAIEGVDAVTWISIKGLDETLAIIAPDFLVVGADHPEVESRVPEDSRNEYRLIVAGGLSEICSDWLVQQIRKQAAIEEQAEKDGGETPRV